MSRSKGFGLLDMVVTLAIAAILITIAIPAYNGFVNRAHESRAIGDIGSISIAIERYRLNNGDRMPADLSDLNADIPLDPWGRPYEYLDIVSADPDTVESRRDGNLNSLNTDFDLYSMGADGATQLPLSELVSDDDIVRARDGSYIGLGENF